MYRNRVLAVSLYGCGELGNESNIDILLGSSATPQPILALLGNDDFVANFVLKNWRL